jgi:hypothetical protein
MASEQVIEVLMRRYVFDSERPFSRVLDGIFGGISQPDIGASIRTCLRGQLAIVPAVASRRVSSVLEDTPSLR